MASRNKLIVVAATPPAPVIDYAAFDEFTSTLDGMASIYQDVDKYIRKLSDCWSGSPDLPKLLSDIEMSYDEWCGDDEDDCAKCHEFDNLFDPDANYECAETRYRLKSEVIGDRLALLINSFPNQGPRAPDDYVRMLLKEVERVRPRTAELEGACRELVRRCKFVPSVAEVLAAINEQKEVWEKRYRALDCLESQRAVLFQLVAKRKSIPAGG